MLSSSSATLKEAKDALISLIKKSKIHFYKPIQIAEILYRDRVHQDISLNDLETYRTTSKKWRDDVTKILVGSVSTSSSKFQDNLFEKNAIPPHLIAKLGEDNRSTNGGIEKFIYDQFRERFVDLSFIADYAENTEPRNFYLSYFIDNIQAKPGLRRSIDKVYEIIVYSFFKILVETMEVDIKIIIKDPLNPIFKEFDNFSKKIFGTDFPNFKDSYPAKMFRVGTTNAADRGLDMWGNFGLAIQIKHLSISEEVVEGIVESVTADRIVIVCKDAEEKTILSIISQLGWKGRVQSVVTFNELNEWYDKAMRGKFANLLGQQVLESLKEQIELEFPATSESSEVKSFFDTRGYNNES